METLDKLKQISEGIDNPEVKMLIDSIASTLKSLYEMLNGKLQLTTKESIGRKLKLNELYLKLNDHDSLKVRLGQQLALIEKLSKYRANALELKKMYNNKIKTLFDVKLSNTTSKDYEKYAQLATQFVFDKDDDLTILDNNKRTYELLELADVFGKDRLNTVLPKSKSATSTTPSTSRWNKK